MQTTTVGVVIGRFQVPVLHKGHRHLIDQVARLHEKLVILLGVTPALSNAHDPLDFPTRKAMISKTYPDAVVMAVPDNPSNEEWSARVDMIIGEAHPGLPAILYGSRESFLPCYSGQHLKREIVPSSCRSGTTVRKEIGKKVLSSKSFRMGAIYSAENRLPISYQVVDVALVNRDKNEVLLGKKRQDGNKWRFIGGFVDPSDNSLEEAARRELREEVGFLEIANITYIGSARIKDYRYRSGPDKILTSFFVASYIFGAPKAADDIDEVRWFPIEVVEEILVPEHKVLGTQLNTHLNKTRAQ